MSNHGNCKSQSLVWPFQKPYVYNPHYIICTIRSINPSTSRWFHEVVRWSNNAFSHNFLKSPQNFIPWSMKTSTRTLNLLNILSKNVNVTPSLLRYGNTTTSNNLENMFEHNQNILVMSKCQTYWVGKIQIPTLT